MANPYFQFKQFTVWHDKCAMKVGTDGVLLGAWEDVNQVNTILDVGTGTGLIALMLAQRCHASIDAIDINENAVEQAENNVANSPWSSRIQVKRTDYVSYTSDKKYDLIISNPPYFQNSLKSSDESKTVARHTYELTYEVLISKTASLLQTNGVFSLIIPTDVKEQIERIAVENGLFSVRQTTVFTKPDIPSKRTLISFKFIQEECTCDQLVIELSRHVYSDEYIRLTRDFYLNL